MQLTFLAIAFLILLISGYRLYGSWVARQFAVDDGRVTPAHSMKHHPYLRSRHIDGLLVWNPDLISADSRRQDVGPVDSDILLPGLVGSGWALLQPRGYLGGFVLYLALTVGVIGVFFGGYEIKQPAFKGWNVEGMTDALFPFFFVTIASGACSGFHGLVCSGTTSKQVDRESHLQPGGYGAMLAEGFVALIALVTIMMVAPSQITGLKPARFYGNGIGEFLTLLIGKENLQFAVTFGAMAFSTFVFDTLDVCTRLGRYILQEVLA